MNLLNFTSFLPEISLLTILILSSFYRFIKLKNELLHSFTFIIGLVLSLAFLIQQFYFNPHFYFSNNISFDNFSSLLKVILTIGFILSSFISGNKIIYRNIRENIYYSVFLFSSFIAISSNNLLLTFAAFEVLNLSYFSFIRLNTDSKSGSVKLSSYYRYWLISSSLMLLGISLFYGLFGSVNYFFVSGFLSANPVNIVTLNIAVLLVFTGFGLKLFVFPFQSVLTKYLAGMKYENTAIIFLSSVLTGSGALLRLVHSAFADTGLYISSFNFHSLTSGFNWNLFLSIIFCISILSTAFILYLQKNLIKVLLYFLLINIYYVLIAGFEKSNPGVNNYLMNIVFICAVSIGSMCILYYLQSQYSIKYIEDLKGLIKNSKPPIIFLFVFLLSSAGLPLTMGFTNRIYIFSMLNHDYSLFIIMSSLIASFISVLVIYKLLTTVFSSREKPIKFHKLNPAQLLLLLLILTVIFLLGILPEPMNNFFNSIIIFNGSVAK